VRPPTFVQLPDIDGGKRDTDGNGRVQSVAVAAIDAPIRLFPRSSGLALHGIDVRLQCDLHVTGETTLVRFGEPMVSMVSMVSMVPRDGS
jgi:hypothetical protein